MAAMLFAQFDITDLPSAFYLGLRVLVAVGAGVLGWFMAGPIAATLHRIAFQKQISRRNRFVSRVMGAILLALLAFLFIPIGPGGGWGIGGPGGPGTDNGQNGGGKPQTTPVEPIKPPTTPTKGGVLPIEIVAKKNYPGDEKYYLINKKGPPKTIAEVEKLIEENKGMWEQIDIIIYSNSFHQEDISVQRLKNLAQKHKLKAAIPPEYFQIEKALEKGSH